MGSAQSSPERPSRTAAEFVRGAGRVALWAVLLLVLVRGLGDIVAPSPDRSTDGPLPQAQAPADEERAFAVQLARAYLTGNGRAGNRSLVALLAPELREQWPDRPSRRGRPPVVVEVTVASWETISPERSVITVACLLSGSASGVRYVAVPVARDAAGGLAAFDLPSLVAGPPLGQVDVDAASPLSGPGAAEIDRLVRRFLAGYVAGAPREDLEFFVAPGTQVGSLAPGLELLRVNRVDALPAEQPERRSVSVAVEVRDSASGAVYPARYRLELVQRERWYVESIRGEVA